MGSHHKDTASTCVCSRRFRRTCVSPITVVSFCFQFAVGSQYKPTRGGRAIGVTCHAGLHTKGASNQDPSHQVGLSPLLTTYLIVTFPLRWFIFIMFASLATIALLALRVLAAPTERSILAPSCDAFFSSGFDALNSFTLAAFNTTGDAVAIPLTLGPDGATAGDAGFFLSVRLFTMFRVDVVCLILIDVDLRIRGCHIRANIHVEQRDAVARQ